ARPMPAGRPLEPVGNGRPRWMTATSDTRYRTRRTGRLVRHLLVVVLAMAVTCVFVCGNWSTVVNVVRRSTFDGRRRPTDGRAEIISGHWWYGPVGAVAAYLAAVVVAPVAGYCAAECQGWFDSDAAAWLGGWSPVRAGLARPGAVWLPV